MNSEKKRKTADLLSICIKAGKAVKGFDSAAEAAENGKAHAILTACDASEKTVKEIRFICGTHGVTVIESELSKAETAQLCGKETAVLAICDDGFAKGFLKFEKND